MIGLLFWPLAIVSIFSAITGLFTTKSYTFVISAILIAPMSFYLSATPKFGMWGLSLVLFYVGGALAIRKRRWLAVLFVIVNLALIGWIGYLAMTSH